MSIPPHTVPRQETALQVEKLERRHSVIEDHDGGYDTCNIVESLPKAGRGVGSIRTRRKEEGSDILPHQTVRILDETPEEETKIVTDIDSVLLKIPREHTISTNSRAGACYAILTQNALVKNVIIVLEKPGFFPLGVIRLYMQLRNHTLVLMFQLSSRTLKLGANSRFMMSTLAVRFQRVAPVFE
jgi:hypothetical protein